MLPSHFSSLTNCSVHAGNHGGRDALGVAEHDFSTNSNACGPCPEALQQVQQADPSHYPDPHYTHLRAELAAWHGVAVEQIVLGASASELIHRFLLAARLAGAAAAQLPLPAYGDYARQAMALGLPVQVRTDADSGLTATTEAYSSAAAGQPGQAWAIEWGCSPSSPHGGVDACASNWLQAPVISTDVRDVAQAGAPWWRVLDAAYAPLQLGQGPQEWLNHARHMQVACWQLFSPNKSLGMTGVRAAYAIAPAQPVAAVAQQQWQACLVQLQALAPSWPLGVHGEAMLWAWMQPSVQHWLHDSRAQLQTWKQAQRALLSELGWRCRASATNFFVAEPPWPDGVLDVCHRHAVLARMRDSGVKLRETDSMGLPNHVRISVQPPKSQQALAQAWRDAMHYYS
ncbi:aminotransferase class I/II-fold pyridoxal phosphate-dependent enzyme [Lampropedia aestuarii]|uniref:histidinol-phosphate transaminase n=1 Tax=Lampropedia aestuarii TaxID=2562762 RepID=A0A4S5BKJ3_9BURK|nr:aminotransferase class I/II-fold pyridoxal phosphate-dependent enzyme [Lampropedia aestuarii]THJ33034.1 aminotransferase class I/II-fold pyridoxal phosphate-dependent enzyme [Lampropedia aestuarii]